MADTKKKDEKKQKTTKSKISNTEWGMVIGVLAIIDAFQFSFDLIGIPFVVHLGMVINPFIDMAVGFAWPTYLYLRGVNLKNVKTVGSIALTFFCEAIPDVDALPLWLIDGIFVFLTIKAEEKIEKETGIDVEKIATAEKDGKVAETQDELDKLNSKSKDDLDLNDKLKLQQAELIMSGKGLRRGQDEEDPVLKAAWEKYDKGIRAYNGVEGEYKFANNTYVGGTGQPLNQDQLTEKGNEDNDETEEGEPSENNNRDLSKSFAQRQKEKDNKGKKKTPAQSGGGRNIGERQERGSESPNRLNLRNFEDEKESEEKESSRLHSNLLDLSLSYGERKKQRGK